MKKKVRWLVNLATICLCVCAIVIGVYAVKTATLNVSGTVGFTANNCNVKITSTVKCAADTTNASATWGQFSQKSIELGAKENSGTANNNQVTKSSEGSLDIGTMNFNDLSTDGNKVEVTFDIENKSAFEVSVKVSTSPTLKTANNATISNDVVSITTTPSGSIKLGSKGSTTYTSSIVVTLIVADILNADETTLKDAKLDMSLKFEKYKEQVMPTKGDLITMTLGATYDSAGGGLQDTYRVLKMDGTTAFVMAMFEANKSQKYWTTITTTTDGKGYEVTKYDGSDLDTYLNDTWYSDLNADAKSAIVESEITQYSYLYSSSVYNADTHASYVDYSTKSAVTGEALERYVYALDVEDIEEYFGDEFKTSDIWTFFWNTTSRPNIYPYSWLRSASQDNAYRAWCVFGGSGILRYNFSDEDNAARPAFKIDLSKIEWSAYAG